MPQAPTIHPLEHHVLHESDSHQWLEGIAGHPWMNRETAPPTGAMLDAMFTRLFAATWSGDGETSRRPVTALLVVTDLLWTARDRRAAQRRRQVLARLHRALAERPWVAPANGVRLAALLRTLLTHDMPAYGALVPDICAWFAHAPTHHPARPEGVTALLLPFLSEISPEVQDMATATLESAVRDVRHVQTLLPLGDAPLPVVAGQMAVAPLLTQFLEHHPSEIARVVPLLPPKLARSVARRIFRDVEAVLTNSTTATQSRAHGLSAFTFGILERETEALVRVLNARADIPWTAAHLADFCASQNPLWRSVGIMGSRSARVPRSR